MASWLTKRRFDDIEALSELSRDWDLDFRQLQAGKLQGSLVQEMKPGFQFSVVAFSRTVRQEGVPPHGGRTFSLLRTPTAHEWCGHQVTEWDLMANHPRNGFSSLSAPGFSLYNVTIAEEIWQRRVRDCLGGGSAADFTRERLLRSRKVTWLRRVLEQYLRLRSSPEKALTGFSVTDDDCVTALFEVLADATRQKTTAKVAHGAERARAVRKACEFIYAQGGNPVGLPDLIRVTGMSERTLQYAFREHTQQSPKTFIRSYRLDCARRELLRGTDSVTCIANRWGFPHLGQFARDYKYQFGELPSETAGHRSNRPQKNRSGLPLNITVSESHSPSS